MSKITIFTIPKAFLDPHVVKIQTNAILSWKNIGLDIQLYSDDEGVGEFAKKHKLEYFPKNPRNEHGTPLLNWAFKKASSVSKNEYLIYANADIIFTSNIFRLLEDIPNSKFLIVGQRIDIDQKVYIDFKDKNWEKNIAKFAHLHGHLHAPTGMDYFLHKKGEWNDLPPLAVGRAAWDNYVLYRARERRFKVVDATKSLDVYHQNHTHSIQQRPGGEWGGPEREAHLKLFNGRIKAFTTEDANYYLDDFRLRVRHFTIAKYLTYLSIAPELYIDNQLISSIVSYITSLLYRVYKLFRRSK